jgi:hypothetical protein
MDEIRTDRGVFTPNDFTIFQEKKILVISPKFQRRAVWRAPARSYFIDTILRKMVVPPLYLRTKQDKETKSIIREVVDGQQRVRSVLEFMGDNGYRLAKNLKAPWPESGLSN